MGQVFGVEVDREAGSLGAVRFPVIAVNKSMRAGELADDDTLLDVRDFTYDRTLPQVVVVAKSPTILDRWTLDAAADHWRGRTWGEQPRDRPVGIVRWGESAADAAGYALLMGRGGALSRDRVFTYRCGKRCGSTVVRVTAGDLHRHLSKTVTGHLRDVGGWANSPRGLVGEFHV